MNGKLGDNLDGGRVEEKWMFIKTATEETTNEAIGKQKSSAREEWFDEECMRAINERNAQMRMLQCWTRNTKANYALKRLMAHKIIRRKKAHYIKELLKEIRFLSANSIETKNFYKKVNNKRNGYKAPAEICRDEGGEGILVEPEQCRNR